MYIFYFISIFNLENYDKLYIFTYDLIKINMTIGLIFSLCYVPSMYKQIKDENGEITTDTEETSKSLRKCIKNL